MGKSRGGMTLGTEVREEVITELWDSGSQKAEDTQTVVCFGFFR
jgi:hypothetical protein